VLARLLRDIRAGKTQIVARLDRLSRSVTHLLAVVEQLETSGAHFHSLRDPIGTIVPQGMFSLNAGSWSVERLGRTVQQLVL